MVIVDFVLAKKREGRWGFLTNRGRINVSVTRAKFLQVLVGDSDAINAPKAKNPKAKEPEANDTEVKDPDIVISDEEDEAFEKDAQPWESSTKPIRLLFEHYKEKGVVVDMDHEDKPQMKYVDLTAANTFLEKLEASRKCSRCGSEDHPAKDCDDPDARITCSRCQKIGHEVVNCTKTW